MLLHTPPEVGSERYVPLNKHTFVVPVIAPKGATVIEAEEKQPLDNVYMIPRSPLPEADKTPVTASIVAIAVLFVLHVPPVGKSDNIAVLPGHTAVGRENAPGLAITDTAIVAVPEDVV